MHPPSILCAASIAGSGLTCLHLVQVEGASHAHMTVVGLRNVGSLLAKRDNFTSAATEPSTTRRGCRCAKHWVQVGTELMYNGTCAYRNPEGGAWTAHHTGQPGFCLVEPDSCEKDDDVLGGDVWDSCEASENPTPPAPEEGKTMCALMITISLNTCWGKYSSTRAQTVPAPVCIFTA